METISCSLDEKVLTITLHRPERMNAFNEKMLKELLDVFNQADENDDVRVIILTGEGKAFCAGSDLQNGDKTFEDTEQLLEDYRDTGGQLSLRIYQLKKPIIAAINGSAVGVGITMTLPMDIRIASTNAKMGFVFCRRGITPEACSGWFLPRVVGISKASEWVLTGRLISAKEALDGGLVSQVVEPNELLETARKIALEIVEHTSAVSIALTRQLFWNMLGASHPNESHLLESKFIYWMGKQPDAREGINSFLEKRKANFQMKASTDLPPFYSW